MTLKIDWALSLKIENAVSDIVSQQEMNGVLFDKELGVRLLQGIEVECTDIYNQIRPFLSNEVVSPYKTPIKEPYLKKGGFNNSVIKWYAENIPEIGGAFTRVEFQEPDINSREKFKKQLLRLGWKPRHFTPKGSPKLTIKNEYDETVPCPSLEETLGDLGGRVARYYILRHRESQISGWVNGSKAKGYISPIRDDGRIPSRVRPDATNTHRMAHSIIANIPRVSSPLGKEMRSLFTVPTGYKMVGADLSGLELRCLASRMEDDVYVNMILNEDIHVYNQEAANLSTRDQAKKFIYTFLYGGGDHRVGQAIGGNARKGKLIKAQFLKALPSLAKLIKQVKRACLRGFLIGLDGRKIWMRKDPRTGKVQDHKALNTLLQCDGAVIAKVALIFMNKLIFTNPKYDAKLLITYHDEVQVEVKEEQADEVGKLLVECFRKAGRFLKTYCPIDGEYKVGNNWAETH